MFSTRLTKDWEKPAKFMVIVLLITQCDPWIEFPHQPFGQPRSREAREIRKYRRLDPRDMRRIGRNKQPIFPQTAVKLG
jgi:hypothetical protein